MTVALSVGVPEIAPVDVLIDNPEGRVGEIAYVRGAVPPEPTTGINEVAALDCVKVFDAIADVATNGP